MGPAVRILFPPAESQVRRFQVVDVLGEVVDDCFLAHMAFLGAFRCHCHSDPPEFIVCVGIGGFLGQLSESLAGASAGGLLPGAVDKYTPQGRLPAETDLSRS
jgi:hypothetical protein